MERSSDGPADAPVDPQVGQERGHGSLGVEHVEGASVAGPPVLGLQGVRHPDRVRVAGEPEVLVGGERDRPDLAEAGSGEGTSETTEEGGCRGEPSRLAYRRQHGADALVPLDAHDLFDQVDLALEVNAIARHLDAHRVLVDRFGADAETIENLPALPPP